MLTGLNRYKNCLLKKKDFFQFILSFLKENMNMAFLSYVKEAVHKSREILIFESEKSNKITKARDASGKIFDKYSK